MVLFNIIRGILDSATLNEIWSGVYEIIKSESPKEIILDASNLKHCDTIGGSFFLKLRKLAQDRNLKLEIINLKNEILQLLNLFNYENLYKVSTETEVQDNSFEKIGKSTVSLYEGLIDNVSFIG